MADPGSGEESAARRSLRRRAAKRDGGKDKLRTWQVMLGKLAAPRQDTPETPRKGFRHPTASFLGTLVVALGGMAAAAAMIIWLRDQGIGRFEFALPILLVAAVIGLVASLAGLVPMFYRAGLTTSQRALGLPAGSVRALIALSFIIMFFITSVFLQSRVDLQTSEVEGVTGSEFTALLDDPDIIVLGAEAEPLVEGQDPTRTVEIGREASEGARQFADRMFSIVATIVVALSAFYFGNQSVAVARGVVGGGGELTLISPEESDWILPGEGKTLDIRLAVVPRGATVTATASAGEVLRVEGQPGLFRFSDPGGLDHAVVTFELPDHPSVQPVTLTLKAGSPDDAAEDLGDEPTPEEIDEALVDGEPVDPSDEDQAKWKEKQKGWKQAVEESEPQ